MYAPQPGKSVVLQQDLPVEDLGMIYLFAAPEASVENIARGEVLGAHLANRAFNRLRTEEQLGYAAGGLATLVGDHPFLGFYIQTPVKAPVAMLERFEAFKQEYQANLAELTAEDFERIKAGVLTNLTEPPKNLSEEAGPFVADWIKERYNFDSRAKLIAAVEAVSIDDIRAYYNATVMAETPSKVLVQLRGRAFANEPFAEIEGATVIDDIASFHKVMATQP
jgi:protease-3